jgi:hypothetical protein
MTKHEKLDESTQAFVVRLTETKYKMAAILDEQRS